MTVFFVCAPPRWGKTFFVTRWAMARLAWNARRRKKKPGFVGQVLSNYPFFSRKHGFPKVLPDNFEALPIFDSMIVVDEAHRKYNSRNIKDFHSWKHDFFAWSGQRGNDIILISHDPGRIDTVVREVAEFFYRVYNFSILGFPLIFFVDGYVTEADYKARTNRYSHEWFFFDFSVARAYNTKFFRNQPDEIPVFEDWSEKLTEEQIALLMRPGPVREFLAALSSRIKALISRVSSMLHRRPAVQPEELEDNLLNSHEQNND